MITQGHTQFRQMHERGEFNLNRLAKKIRRARTVLANVLAGSEPKLSLALDLERELGIPSAAWAEPADLR